MVRPMILSAVHILVTDGMKRTPIQVGLLILIAFSVTVYFLFDSVIRFSNRLFYPDHENRSEFLFNGSWYPPGPNPIDDLEAVLHNSGTFGYRFDDSGSDVGEDEVWNWCNMPHVNPRTYVRPDSKYKLEYVEVIHRHHKRTPYGPNLFPSPPHPWNCSSSTLQCAIQSQGIETIAPHYDLQSDPSNPFSASLGDDPPSCFFPQITPGGLDDSHAHGHDLFAVYHDLLSFFPSNNSFRKQFRVTNNPITSQVASALLAGMLPAKSNPSGEVPLTVQSSLVDSLEPTYPCSTASSLLASYGPTSHNRNWTAHLTASADVFAHLDAITQVPSTNKAFHRSYDHYFDNLSSRLCHSLPLPCSSSSPPSCVDTSVANTVFRLGHHEYAHIYRSNPSSLAYSTARFGAWISELLHHFHEITTPFSATTGDPEKVQEHVRYRHNIAHDGSIAALLSILQIDVMGWPGMGAEVVFELYSTHDSTRHQSHRPRHGGDAEGKVNHEQGPDGHKENSGPSKNGEVETEGSQEEENGKPWFIRVLYSGQPLKSQVPTLNVIDMLPLDRLTAYLEDLVGKKGEKVREYCAG